MELPPLARAIVMTAVVLVVMGLFFAMRGRRKRFRGVGAGASGSFYEMLSEDKRKAIEIIVEERAEARDGETADDLTDPPAPAQNAPMPAKPRANLPRR